MMSFLARREPAPGCKTRRPAAALDSRGRGPAPWSGPEMRGNAARRRVTVGPRIREQAEGSGPGARLSCAVGDLASLVAPLAGHVASLLLSPLLQSLPLQTVTPTGLLALQPPGPKRVPPP